MYKQGEIVIVKFSFTDGPEFKKRPALVISNSHVNRSGDYLLVQITSKLVNDGLPVAIADNDCYKPLPLKSSVRSHKIFTVHESCIISNITRTTPDFLKMVTHRIFQNIEMELI